MEDLSDFNPCEYCDEDPNECDNDPSECIRERTEEYYEQRREC